MSGTYKTGASPPGHAGRVKFDTKVAVVVRDDLAGWQRLNVTAFLVSGIAGAHPQLMGEPYEDADGTTYLPLLGQPVVVLEADADTLRAAHARALSRELATSIYTHEMFSTGHDEANRAVVRAVARDDLDLVGLAVFGPRNGVDKTVKGARLHP
ncbi:MAG TPA: DUF2000 domain-containing protein [Nocardioides sp.]|nr:DUF2000 domain-containing protein [uncultured Nocardioides sp.]HCB05692.1 DUF2000 domain-containing protein [Nocardioides sp.]HRD63033.1 DUF2000 domain-containing protein [Nocardioides sp.]HRI96809.1 DUF2000 domain-containing protein [Nocardioides sp.]HRK46959.1 DUF2000 domain-containing protein [Nocardioides sp.]